MTIILVLVGIHNNKSARRERGRREHTTGTHIGHEIINNVTCLLPNFGTGGLVMNLRISGIVELIGQKI